MRKYQKDYETIKTSLIEHIQNVVNFDAKAFRENEQRILGGDEDVRYIVFGRPAEEFEINLTITPYMTDPDDYEFGTKLSVKYINLEDEVIGLQPDPNSGDTRDTLEYSFSSFGVGDLFDLVQILDNNNLVFNQDISE